MKTNDRDFQIPPKITIIKLLFFFHLRDGGREMEEDLSERKLLDTREREKEREKGFIDRKAHCVRVIQHIRIFSN